MKFAKLQEWNVQSGDKNDVFEVRNEISFI